MDAMAIRDNVLYGPAAISLVARLHVIDWMLFAGLLAITATLVIIAVKWVCGDDDDLVIEDEGGFWIKGYAGLKDFEERKATWFKVNREEYLAHAKRCDEFDKRFDHDIAAD